MNVLNSNLPTNAAVKATAKHRVRRFFYELHLWLGIVSGLILFIVCLSGCIYVFRPDIELLLEPDKYYVNPEKTSEPMSISALIEKIEQEQGGRILTYIRYDNPRRTDMIVLLLNVSEDTGRSLGRVIYVNPYDGSICGEGTSCASRFFVSIMQLHCFLWLPRHIGQPIVGVATIVFAVLIVSGLVLWVPVQWRKAGNWKFGFMIRTKKGGNRFLYDIHNTLGFYLTIPMLILALTGLCWSFGWYRTALGTVLNEPVFGGQPLRTVECRIPDTTQPVPVSQLVAQHHELQPGRGDMIISLPVFGNNGTVVTQKGGYGFFAFAVKDKVEWNRYTGEAVNINRFRDKHPGAKISVLIRSLHLGDVMGLGSRVFFFIVCLVATTLPVTGVWLWINKLRRHRKTHLKKY